MGWSLIRSSLCQRTKVPQRQPRVVRQKSYQLWAVHCMVSLGCARDGLLQYFLSLSYLKSRDRILKEASSNELVGPWHLLLP